MQQGINSWFISFIEIVKIRQYVVSLIASWEGNLGQGFAFNFRG